MNRNQKIYQIANEYLQEENQRLAEKMMKEVYKEKKTQLDNTVNYTTRLFSSYQLDENGGLKLSQTDKKKIKMETNDFLTTMGVKLAKNEEDVITQLLEDVAINSFNKTNFILDIGMSFDLPVGNLSKDDINKIINKKLENKTFSSRIWDNQSQLILQLNKELSDVISNGKDIRKASQMIKNRFAVNSFCAKRLVQNEAKNVQTRIQEQIYQDSNVVDEIMWSSTLDDRTRLEHREFDGKKWGKNENYPSPESFVSCRCSLIPVIKGWQPSKRYLQQDGETIDYKTYEDWKKDRVDNQKGNTSIDKAFESLLPSASTELLKGLQDAHNDCLQHGLSTGNEKLNLIDSNGKSVGELKGANNEVIFTRDLIDILDNSPNNSKLLVHNHPSSSSFSAEDLNVMCRYNSIKSITVEGHDGTKYSCSIDKGQRLAYNDIKQKYKQYDNEVRPYFADKVINQKLDKKIAWKEHSNYAMSKLANELGWDYKRIITDDYKDIADKINNELEEWINGRN